MLAHNRAWYLMARSLSNEVSEAEKAELQLLLQQDENLQQHYAMLKEFWVPSSLPATQSSAKLEALLSKAKEQEKEPAEIIAPKKKIITARFAWAAAASLFAVMVIGYFILQRKNTAASIAKANTLSYSDSIITSRGNRSHLILPDGSRVWLNSGSKLLYQRTSGKTREVQLIGEAYFDVVKNPERPFIVHAEGINIRVLGTVFNVRCYPGEKDVETTLLHGAVSVTHNDDPGKKPILLSPNQKLTISKAYLQDAMQHTVAVKTYELKNLDTTIQPAHLQETAWVYNRLEFRNMDFRTLAAKMERWYNVNIVFADSAVQRLRFVGSFENETIEEALHALQSVARFEFSIQDQEIHIHSFK